MSPPVVFFVDDDQAVRDGLALLLEAAGLNVQSFESAEAFLRGYDPRRGGCLVLDVRMPGMSGPQLHEELVRRGWSLPVIFLTAHGDIPMSVRAIKAGAVDFLTKPVAGADLLERVDSALQYQRELSDRDMADEARKQCLARLTLRETEVLELALAGHSNKAIGRQLHISFRTVEIHRSRIMQKTGAANLLELARLFMNPAPSAAPRWLSRARRPRAE
jgi:FixJ family two-component response regulator